MKLQLFYIFIAFGAGNHLFFNKEITAGYAFKKCIVPIVIAVGICYLLSLFTKNFYIASSPIWLLVGVWTFLGYYEYYKLIKALFINYKNRNKN